MERQRQVVILVVVANAIALLALAVATFAIARNQDESRDEAPTMQPAEAILDLTRFGKERWRTTLGENCLLDEVPVMVVGSSSRGHDVIVMPGDCYVNRFTVIPEDGGLRTEDPLTGED